MRCCKHVHFKESHIMNITIYHNPACGTSRNTLALIRNAGTEPEIIEYLEQSPSLAALTKLISDAGLTVREAMRQKGTPYAELGLDAPDLTDRQLLDAMLAHPILINRPFVVTPNGTRLCRPSELVLDILSSPQKGSFTKEDGEVVINAEGQRVTKPA
jgi:arsenate reductase (glutaredoxin)